MNDFIDKMVQVEKDISGDRGGLSFFAVFLREDGINKWDLVVAAPWFGDDEFVTLTYVSDKLRSRLSDKDFLKLSRIAVLQDDDERVKVLQKQFRNIEHKKRRVQNSEFFGMQMRDAYIITAKAREAAQQNVA